MVDEVLTGRRLEELLFTKAKTPSCLEKTTAENTGLICKEGVNALKLITTHLPDIPNKSAETLKLPEVEDKDAWKK
eukprot:7718736-Ditylum_brightwellii.AAC.1